MAPVSARRRRGRDPLRPLAGVAILAVDDDADARELLRVAFQQAGARVTVADSARAALAALEAAAPDVLVSDIGMPDGNGYELLESVRAAEHGSRLPAVALTAYARVEDRDRAHPGWLPAPRLQADRPGGAGARRRPRLRARQARLTGAGTDPALACL